MNLQRSLFALVLSLSLAPLFAQELDSLNAEARAPFDESRMALHYFRIDWSDAQWENLAGRRVTMIYFIDEVGEPFLEKLQGIDDAGIIDSFQVATGRLPYFIHRLAPEMESVAYSVSDQQVLAEVYAYGQHRLGNKWLLGAGLKPIHDVKRGFTRLNTQASLRYQPGPREKWHLSAGRFAQLLSPDPEVTIWQWLDLSQVALEYSGSFNQWSWEAAVFAKTERYDRLDDLFVLGAEAKFNFKSEHWTAWISTTSVRNRGLNTHTPTRRDLPFFARTQVQRRLGGQWNLGLAGSWRRGTYFRPLRDRTIIPDTENWFAPVYADEGSRLPNYLRLDLSVSKIFIVGNGSLIVYLNVNNLLNSENVSAYTYDADFSSRSSQFYSRRLLFVGATYQFTPGAD